MTFDLSLGFSSSSSSLVLWLPFPRPLPCRLPWPLPVELSESFFLVLLKALDNKAFSSLLADHSLSCLVHLQSANNFFEGDLIQVLKLFVEVVIESHLIEIDRRKPLLHP